MQEIHSQEWIFYRMSFFIKDNLISEKYIIFTGKIIKRHVLTLSVDNISTDLISNYKN